MYVSFVFLGYIFAVFLALIGIALIVLVVMKNRVETTERFKSVRNFSVSILLISVLYFFFYCRENVQEIYEIPVTWRIADYILCSFVFCFWLTVIGRFKETKGHIFRVAVIIGTVRSLAGAVVTAGYMDSYYYIENTAARNFYSCFEAAAVFATSVAIIWYTIAFIRDNAEACQKKFTAVVSALLIMWDINQIIVDAGLYFGRFGKSVWMLEIFDPTGPVMLIIALMVFLFVFREDFSPLYFVQTEEDPAGSLDIAAEKHRLTVRECEVMKLMYEGCSNPEIAEKLYISRNTVKKHIQSIYEKMGVSNRMELIHLVNSKPPVK